MGEFTQEQLDAAISKAAADAVAKYQSENPPSSLSQKDIDDAVANATGKLKADLEAEKQAAIDKERSKKDEVTKRLREANKKQVPTALEGLDDDEIQNLLEIAPYVKGMSQEKRLTFIENISTGSYQNMLVTQRETWHKDTLEPVQSELERVKSELASVKADNLKKTRTEPLRQALLENCNPDPHSQRAGLREISDIFEDGLDDDGNLIPKTSGPNNGIDPDTNKPFTAETAAKYLARTISFLTKPSSSSTAGGDGKTPPAGSESRDLVEQLKGKTKEEKLAIMRARKSAGG